MELSDIDFRYINAEFIMTNGCNLHCEYCFERERMTNNGKVFFLKESDIRGYIELILKNRKERGTPSGVPSWINFFGGEPMLCWDLMLKIMREYYEKYKFFRFSIITNGLIIDKETGNPFTRIAEVRFTEYGK